MRANLYETILRRMLDNKDNPDYIQNYLAKAEILLKREGSNLEESVVRELSNGD